MPKEPMVMTMFTHKGGVGKTTATYNLSALLAKNCRVLMIDADPQCNLSKSFLQSKLAHRLDSLDEESRQDITGSTIRQFLKGTPRDPLNLSQYAIELVIDLTNEKELRQRYAHDNLDNKFILCRISSDSGDDEEEQLSWFVYGQNNDHKKVLEQFDDFNKVVKIGREERLLTGDEQLTDEEKQDLSFLIAVKLEKLDYNVDEIFQELIDCQLELKNEFDEKSYQEELKRKFILTKKGAMWQLYFCSDSINITINIAKDLPDLQLYLVSCKTDPESLDKSQVAEIVRRVKQWRFVNFYEAFNSNAIAKSNSKESIEQRAAKLSLLEIKSSQINEGLKSGEDNALLLLPGSYTLLLDLSRQFSFGIQGLKDKSIFQNFSNNIYKLNEFIRYLAKLHDIDVVMIDLSPSADDFNSTLLMISDYFLTTVNPEAYSDDAVESLLTILSRWSMDFKPLYEDEDHPDRYQRISKPPVCLGYFLQKMDMIGDQLKSSTAKKIALRIKAIFDKDIIPLLRENNMYPPFGLVGYDEEFKAISDKVPHGVPRFTQNEVAIQHRGALVVWEAGCQPYVSAFTRVLMRTIGNAILHDPVCSERLRKIFEDLKKAETERSDDFARKWADKYLKFREDLSYEDRQKLVINPDYKFDYIDMMCALSGLRFQYLRGDKDIFKEGADQHNPNKFGLFIADPCRIDELLSKLKEIVSRISSSWTGDHRLRYMILTVFTGQHWMAVRAEVNYYQGKSASLSLLIDDPRGGVLEGGAKKIDPSHRSGYQMPQNIWRVLVDAIHKQLLSYIRSKELYNDRHWQFSRVMLLCKSVDQQGYLYNDTDSGPIILRNISDYIELDGNENFYPNRMYEKTAEEYQIEAIFEEHNLDKLRLKSIKFKAQDGSLVAPDLYAIKEKASKGSDGEIREIRKGLRALYKNMAGDLRLYVKDLHIANSSYSKYYADYLLIMLQRIPVDFRQEIISWLAGLDGHAVSEFITALRLQVFLAPGTKNRRMKEYNEGDFVAKSRIVATLQSLGVKTSQKSFSSAIGSSSSAAVDRRTDTSYRASFYGAQESSIFSLTSDPQHKFRRHAVNADGDCGYTSFGITRESAFDLLCKGVEEGDQGVIDLLKQAVYEQMLDQEFIDYFESQIDDVEGFLAAHQDYQHTHQNEALIDYVDAHPKDTILAYLTYDVMEKRVEKGWCHPRILQALALSRDLHLKIWRKEAGSLVPHQGAEFDYADFNGGYGHQCLNLLYVNGNHFELLDDLSLEVGVSEQAISSGQSHQHDESERRVDSEVSAMSEESDSEEEYRPESSRKRKDVEEYQRGVSKSSKSQGLFRPSRSTPVKLSASSAARSTPLGRQKQGESSRGSLVAGMFGQRQQAHKASPAQASQFDFPDSPRSSGSASI